MSEHVLKFIQQISKQVARDVMDEGNEYGEKCRRIQFKVGFWPDSEKDAGGLCEHALANVIETSLRNQLFATVEETV